MKNNDLSFIPRLLPAWYEKNARRLPWREDKEPYHVWLSEIMLQQTRVEAVIGYYNRFLSALPTIRALAEVPDEQLMKLWEGLGYYSRARNLKKAAAQIQTQFGGVFPQTYDEIRLLPGIGPYTAGAVASICFGLPTPAVDGNVLRVYSRLTAWGENVDTQKAKNEATQALRPLYKKNLCGTLTQSLMELGACVCVPNGVPKCEACPLAAYCKANAAGTQIDFPVRGEKKKRKIIYKTVLVLRCGDCVAIQKRPASGLLAGLWEFPNFDAETAEAAADLEKAAAFAAALGVKPLDLVSRASYTHIFTHVEWRMTAFYFVCAAMPDTLHWPTEEELSKTYALPSAFRPFADALHPR
ncbi:MAG: A/G-specific adenine glycosylase [Clostridia bacterium]|nr:A/G-specific adenine glycosylase [Clostridia bacterium]